MTDYLFGHVYLDDVLKVAGAVGNSWEKFFVFWRINARAARDWSKKIEVALNLFKLIRHVCGWVFSRSEAIGWPLHKVFWTRTTTTTYCLVQCTHIDTRRAGVLYYIYSNPINCPLPALFPVRTIPTYCRKITV